MPQQLLVYCLYQAAEATMTLLPTGYVPVFISILLSLLFTDPTFAAPTVTVLNGTYTGLHLASFDQDLFLGIPYAQNAGGQNRFRIPQALNESWDGTRDAVAYSDQCPDDSYKPGSSYGMSEDCLSLNIIRPGSNSTNSTQGQTPLPVMVWIHGGSYQRGTTGLPNYNLTYVVARSVEIGRPILGVSINYRKGGWGNMYSIEIAVSLTLTYGCGVTSDLTNTGLWQY